MSGFSGFCGNAQCISARITVGKREILRLNGDDRGFRPMRGIFPVPCGTCRDSHGIRDRGQIRTGPAGEGPAGLYRFRQRDIGVFICVRTFPGSV